MKTRNHFLKLLLPVVCLVVIGIAACHKDKHPTPVPVIQDFFPKHGEVDSVVTITGYGFSNASMVTLNGVAAAVISASGTEIKFKVPAHATAGKIVVKQGGKEYSSNTDFVVTITWIERSSFSEGQFLEGVSFVYNNKLYIGLGYSGMTGRNFKIFDPQTNTWSQGPVSPAPGTIAAICFVLNNKTYVGNGYYGDIGQSDEWYEYNPAQTGDAAWKKMTNYPTAGGGGWAFVLNDKAYVAMPYWDNARRLHVFEPDANSGKGQWIGLDSGVPDLDKPSVFTIGNFTYICGGYSISAGSDINKLYRFDPTTGTFTTLASFPDGTLNDRPSFSINGKGYVIAPGGIYEYDPCSDKWTRKNELPGNSWGVYNAAVVNNRAFYWAGVAGRMYEYIPGY